MTFQDKMAQGIIHLLFNPFHRHKPVDFHNVLNEANTVLITCPIKDESSITPDILKHTLKLFPGKKCHFICPDDAGTGLADSSGHHILRLDFSKHNLWNILRSEVLKKCSEKNWDIFLDLDSEFNILNAYLTRKLQPTLSIGFQKPYSQKFLNMEYNSRSADPYSKKLDGLFNFLQKFLSDR